MNAPGGGSGGRRRRAADDDDTRRAERAVGVPERSRTWDIGRIGFRVSVREGAGRMACWGDQCREAPGFVAPGSSQLRSQRTSCAVSGTARFHRACVASGQRGRSVSGREPEECATTGAGVSGRELQNISRPPRGVWWRWPLAARSLGSSERAAPFRGTARLHGSWVANGMRGRSATGRRLACRSYPQTSAWGVPSAARAVSAPLRTPNAFEKNDFLVGFGQIGSMLGRKTEITRCLGMIWCVSSLTGQWPSSYLPHCFRRLEAPVVCCLSCSWPSPLGMRQRGW